MEIIEQKKTIKKKLPNYIGHRTGNQIQIRSKSTWTSSNLNPNQIQSQIFPSNSPFFKCLKSKSKSESINQKVGLNRIQIKSGSEFAHHWLLPGIAKDQCINVLILTQVTLNIIIIIPSKWELSCKMLKLKLRWTSTPWLQVDTWFFMYLGSFMVSNITVSSDVQFGLIKIHQSWSRLINVNYLPWSRGDNAFDSVFVCEFATMSERSLSVRQRSHTWTVFLLA